MKKVKFSNKDYDSLLKYHKRRIKDEANCTQHIFDRGEIGKFHHCINCGKIRYVSFTPFTFINQDKKFLSQQIKDIDDAIQELSEFRRKLLSY